MVKKDGQFILRKDNLYFDLKKIIAEHNVKTAAVIYNFNYNNSILVRYISEMGAVLSEYDFSDVSYDKHKVDELIEQSYFSGTQLVIAVGDGALINAVKYAAHNGSFEGAPFIYIPSHIEAGDEKNGYIVLFDNEHAEALDDESTIPDYIMYDPESIDTSDKYTTNACIAEAIAQAVFLLWTNDAKRESAVLAASGLKSLVRLTTRIQRGDKTAFCDALKAAADIGIALEIAETKTGNFPALVLSDLCDMHPGQAMIKMATAMCLEMENYLISKGIASFPADYSADIDTTIDGEPDAVYERAINLAKALTPDVRYIHGISEQMAFFEFALNMHERNPETEEILKIAEEFDTSVFSCWPTPVSDDDARLILLHAFHKEELGRSLERYEFNLKVGSRPKTSARRIEELNEMYGDDLSYGRIIWDPAYEKRIERQEIVKGLQKDVLETLLLSKNLLEKYGLRYYLSEGTLLGAVRHKGFIPWDDDVDIMMPREDYNKLVELDRKGMIPPELHFDSLENNPKHWVLGAKLQLTRESKYSQPKVEGLSEFNGPYIDVFPLDYWNSPYSKMQYRAQRRVKMCRRLLFMKTGYSKVTKGKLHRILMRIAVPFIPNTSIEKYAIKNMTKFNDGNRKYMVHLASYYKYYKEVFPSSCYGEPVYLEFEGHEFPVPKEYDFILKTIYGVNYDSLPPARVANMRNHPFDVSDDD